MIANSCTSNSLLATLLSILMLLGLGEMVGMGNNGNTSTMPIAPLDSEIMPIAETPEEAMLLFLTALTEEDYNSMLALTCPQASDLINPSDNILAGANLSNVEIEIEMNETGDKALVSLSGNLVLNAGSTNEILVPASFLPASDIEIIKQDVGWIICTTE